MRVCSQCKVILPPGAHAKKCREPGCDNILCDACYHKYHYCPDHLVSTTVSIDGSDGSNHCNGGSSLSCGPCHAAAENFRAWLSFYKTLMDPMDLKERSYIVSNQSEFDGDTMIATLHFKRGSTVELYWLGALNESRDDIIAKIPISSPSKQMCAGVFRPSGLLEASDRKQIQRALEPQGVAVIFMDCKQMSFNKKSRIASALKPLFNPRMIHEMEQDIRSDIQELLGQYLRVSELTILDKTGQPAELVRHCARRMAEEKQCRVKKTMNGLDVLRYE